MEVLQVALSLFEENLNVVLFNADLWLILITKIPSLSECRPVLAAHVKKVVSRSTVPEIVNQFAQRVLTNKFIKTEVKQSLLEAFIDGLLSIDSPEISKKFIDTLIQNHYDQLDCQDYLKEKIHFVNGSPMTHTRNQITLGLAMTAKDKDVLLKIVEPYPTLELPAQAAVCA